MTDIGKKGKKDNDAPKKPMGAFFCYQKTRREAVSKENPKLNNKQVVSVPDSANCRKCLKNGATWTRSTRRFMPKWPRTRS